jgi:alpha-acetolactate decarboxylase
MNKLTYTLVVVFLITIITSCESKVTNNKRVEVKYSGALRTIMSGNVQSTISLDSLSNRANMYALGAVENLKGEIQIFNSIPSNSFVKDSSIQINDSYNLKASLLVYTEVEEWNEFNIDNIATKEDLERTIFETAKANGINTEVPFPFLLKGRAVSLDWHVINWIDGDTIHTHEKHKESGMNGKLINRAVEVLGFYSTKHKAIFTHHTTNMHMHFKTADNSVAGHIDAIRLNTIILSLPKSKK